MDRTIRPVVTAVIDDLERACCGLDVLRQAGPDAHLDSFELAEASHAAHRALMVLRGWDWTPGPGLAVSAVLCEAP